MLTIGTLDLSAYLTDYRVSQSIRGVKEVETMDGSTYRYGTGVGYVIQASLKHVPASKVSSILNIAGSPNESFSSTFYAFGEERTADCYAERFDTALTVNDSFGGIWEAEMELRTV